jgi:hypothetical protein
LFHMAIPPNMEQQQPIGHFRQRHVLFYNHLIHV